MARAIRWTLAKVWGEPGNIHFWWNVGGPFFGATVVDAFLFFVRDAPLWQLIPAFVGFYVVFLLVSTRLRRRGMTDRGNSQEPEETRGSGDYRSVTSHGQMGGQTAWSIRNEGPQPRQITRGAGDVLVGELRKHPPERFLVTSMTDAESNELGSVLRELLRQGGWHATMDYSAMGMVAPMTPRGLIVETKSESDAVSVLIGWLGRVRLNPQVNRGEPRDPSPMTDSEDTPRADVHIVVGVLPR